MEVLTDDEGKGTLLPPIGQHHIKDNKLRVPVKRRSSSHLPSLGSIVESENETQSFDSSDSAFEESSQFSSRSSFVGREDSNLSVINNIVLEENEEREIEKKVRQEFKQEFQAIKAQTKEKQKILRKKFKSKINHARSKLLLARANAEKETIEKLQEEAERKEAEILNERKKRRDLNSKNKDTFQETAIDLAALRKVRAKLDRAKARRRSTIATSLVLTRHKGMNAGIGVLPDYEIRRLEKEDEITKIVEELQSLGLSDAATNLAASLDNKMSSEEQLIDNLKQERQQAKLKAMEKKNLEVERLRKEKIEEKEMLERERMKREAEERERLERERRIRIMNALKRKAFNIEMRKSLTHAKLTTKVSRPYTYSYFHTQR